MWMSYPKAADDSANIAFLRVVRMSFNTSAEHIWVTFPSSVNWILKKIHWVWMELLFWTFIHVGEIRDWGSDIKMCCVYRYMLVWETTALWKHQLVFESFRELHSSWPDVPLVFYIQGIKHLIQLFYSGGLIMVQHFWWHNVRRNLHFLFRGERPDWLQNKCKMFHVN